MLHFDRKDHGSKIDLSQVLEVNSLCSVDGNGQLLLKDLSFSLAHTMHARRQRRQIVIALIGG